MQPKIPVIILGATGSVGQRFVELLANHPWFLIAGVAASERSIGKTYREATHWMMSTPMPESVASLVIQPCIPLSPETLVFSALDSHVATEIERHFADAGCFVVSNARNYRMNPDVPLLIPEVNASHLSLLQQQNFKNGGKIVTNPNCSAIGLCLALKPIHDLFGLEAIHVVTMQAVSGAGYPGVASLDMIDNVIPYICDEENKLESEPLKIFGRYHEGGIVEAPIVLSAHCNRVAVSDGHTESVSFKLKRKASAQELIEAWNTFSAEPQQWQLPSAPARPIYYFDEPSFPQPRLHRALERGMSVAIGRLRSCPLFDYKCTLLSHNTIRGAAGGAILCAEMAVYTKSCKISSR